MYGIIIQNSAIPVYAGNNNSGIPVNVGNTNPAIPVYVGNNNSEFSNPSIRRE